MGKLKCDHCDRGDLHVLFPTSDCGDLCYKCEIKLLRHFEKELTRKIEYWEKQWVNEKQKSLLSQQIFSAVYKLCGDSLTGRDDRTVIQAISDLMYLNKLGFI